MPFQVIFLPYLISLLPYRIIIQKKLFFKAKKLFFLFKKTVFLKLFLDKATISSQKAKIFRVKARECVELWLLNYIFLFFSSHNKNFSYFCQVF